MAPAGRGATDPILMDRTTVALAKAASASLLRQQVINANIANAETPGYQPLKVEFEATLEAALRKGKTAGSSAGAGVLVVEDVIPEVVAQPKVAQVAVSGRGARRWDGNGVNVEREMVALAEATLQHEAVVRLLSHKLRMLQLAIGGRGG